MLTHTYSSNKIDLDLEAPIAHWQLLLQNLIPIVFWTGNIFPKMPPLNQHGDLGEGCLMESFFSPKISLHLLLLG